MILLALITYGFGLLCSITVVVPVVLLLKSVRHSKLTSAWLKLVVHGYIAFCGLFAAYWCSQILQTCWLLVAMDGGPGPFGLFAFPFWAVIAATPALVGLALLRAAAKYTTVKRGH
jgi:hypothetical protein